MKKNLTELVFILDRSGSMENVASDIVGGFNSLIKKQRSEDGECLVSTVLFNAAQKVLHDRKPLSQIDILTSNDYVPHGSTALIDAIGSSIHHIGNIHKYARSEDIPEHTLFVIMTDGLENSSCRYTSDKVKQMIERQKEKYGWEFLFIGANIDAVETAQNIGISEDRAANYISDSKGTGIVYNALSAAVCSLRKNKNISADWSQDIIKDHTKRK